MKIKLLLFISNILSKLGNSIGRIGSIIYYKYCIEKCYSCNGSGLKLLFENDTIDCKYCKGQGYNERNY